MVPSVDEQIAIESQWRVTSPVDCSVFNNEALYNAKRKTWTVEGKFSIPNGRQSDSYSATMFFDGKEWELQGITINRQNLLIGKQ